jgi:hypothetical protein
MAVQEMTGTAETAAPGIVEEAAAPDTPTTLVIADN